MIQPRVIPILLLKRDGLFKGVHFKDYKYVGDPMNAVRIFNDKNVDEIFLIDITATQEKRLPEPDFIQRVADESYMPFGVGGGIRSVDDMRKLLKAGAEKVSVNTAAIEQPELIREGASSFGSQSVTVAIDVKKDWLGRNRVFSHCGSRNTGMIPMDWARRAEDCGAGEIMIMSIDRDGTGLGYDVELIKSIADAVAIPVIASGGARTVEHLRQAIESGASAVAAGSMFVFSGPHRAVLIQYTTPGSALMQGTN